MDIVIEMTRTEAESAQWALEEQADRLWMEASQDQRNGFPGVAAEERESARAYEMLAGRIATALEEARL